VDLNDEFSFIFPVRESRQTKDSGGVSRSRVNRRTGWPWRVAWIRPALGRILRLSRRPGVCRGRYREQSLALELQAIGESLALPRGHPCPGLDRGGEFLGHSPSSGCRHRPLIGFIPMKMSASAKFSRVSEDWNSGLATISAVVIRCTVWPVLRFRARTATLSLDSKSARTYSEAERDFGSKLESVVIPALASPSRQRRGRRGRFRGRNP
jgi:hypothetical protein